MADVPPQLHTTATTTITFKDHTPVNPKTVPPCHCGRLQLRLYSGDDPKLKGGMEYYYPAGTTVTIPDYVAHGAADLVSNNPAPVAPIAPTPEAIDLPKSESDI